MSLYSFFALLESAYWKSRASRRGSRPARGFRCLFQLLQLEKLERRIVPGFLDPLAFDAGSGPTSAVVGDFNGDGIPDLVVANRDSDYVSVLLGNGDGTFQSASNFPAGSHPLSVAVGDFDRDGNLDLAVVGFYCGNDGCTDETVRVLLGNGDGSFESAGNFLAGSRPSSVAVGDFNFDGILDLAVANEGSNNVSVLLGNGDGTFQAARNFSAGNRPSSVVVADFDGDGYLDLAVANAGSNNFSVLLGNGDGSFRTFRNFAAGSGPNSLYWAGPGVGFLMAVANAESNNVSVLLANGDGTFQPARNFPAGDRPSSVVVGHFSGSLWPDLAVANEGSDNVSVLLGNGVGSFQPALDFPAGSQPRSVAVGDFNGDGWPDLAVANSGSNDVSILLNDAYWPQTPDGAPGRGARRPSKSDPLDFWSLNPASTSVYPTELLSSIPPSALTPQEPVTPAGLVDALFAAPTGAERAVDASEVPPLRRPALSAGRLTLLRALQIRFRIPAAVEETVSLHNSEGGT
jgi:hypothetical protein